MIRNWYADSVPTSFSAFISSHFDTFYSDRCSYFPFLAIHQLAHSIIPHFLVLRRYRALYSPKGYTKVVFLFWPTSLPLRFSSSRFLCSTRLFIGWDLLSLLIPYLKSLYAASENSYQENRYFLVVTRLNSPHFLRNFLTGFLFCASGKSMRLSPYALYESIKCQSAVFFTPHLISSITITAFCFLLVPESESYASMTEV